MKRKEDVSPEFEEIHFQISQGFAIGAALETAEDKLYWIASTQLGMLMQGLGRVDELEPIVAMNSDLFMAAAVGPVHLPLEYKAIIHHLVEIAFSSEVMAAQRASITEAFGSIGDAFDE